MSNSEVIIKRRKKVWELKRRHWTQSEIAKHLKVSEHTVSNDVKAINEDQQQFIIKHPDYLGRTNRALIEHLDKSNLIVKKLYDLVEGRAESEKIIENMVNKYEKKLKYTEEEMKIDKNKRKRFDDREGQRKNLREKLYKIATMNRNDQIKALEVVRRVQADQAKTRDLIPKTDSTYTQNNFYLHVDKLKIVFAKIVIKLESLIKTFVPKEKQGDACEYLKNLNFEEDI